MFIYIVIRSWKVHRPSRTAQPPQDFITINKLAIKMNAHKYSSSKGTTFTNSNGKSERKPISLSSKANVS